MPRDEGREDFLAVAAYGPTIAIKVGITFLRMKRQVNRSGKLFYQELVRNGVPPVEAKKLKEEYTSVTSVRHWVKTLRGLSSMGDMSHPDRY